MDYKIKYLKYKEKYLQLKKYKLSQFKLLNGGSSSLPEVKANADPEVKPTTDPEVKANADPEVKANAEPEVKTEVNTDPEVKAEVKTEPEVKPTTDPEVKTESDSDINTNLNIITKEEQTKKDNEINRPKVDQGRGLIGDLINCNKENHFFNNLLKPSPWDFVEPEINQIIPDKIPYTEFNQEIINKIYLHKNLYEEGFNIGYIIGYECGINLDYTPGKKEVPGNISNYEFINGFLIGWDIAFAKGKKYYYTKYLQLNNNNKINENYDYDIHYINVKKILTS